MVAVLLVCAGVALAQAGVGLAVRHGTPPRWLTPTPGRARALLLAGLAVCVVVALLAGAPARISHAWQDFKHPAAAALHDDSIARFGTVERERALRLLESGDRRHQWPPARGLWRWHIPAAVGPSRPVLQLRGKRALAVRGDARGNRRRRAGAAGVILPVGARGCGHAVPAVSLRGEGTGGWVDRGADRIHGRGGGGLALASPRVARGVPAPGRRAASARGRPGTEARAPAAPTRRDRRRDRVRWLPSRSRSRPSTRCAQARPRC